MLDIKQPKVNYNVYLNERTYGKVIEYKYKVSESGKIMVCGFTARDSHYVKFAKNSKHRIKLLIKIGNTVYGILSKDFEEQLMSVPVYTIENRKRIYHVRLEK